MKKTLLIATIALIITAGTVSLVDAQMRGEEKSNRPELTEEMEAQMEEHRAEMEAQREKMNEIMENGTYEEWKAEIESRPKITDYITVDNFTNFQEAHKLRKSGDFEGAREIMEELGIEGKFGMMGKGGMSRGPKGIKQMNGNGNGECLQQ